MQKTAKMGLKGVREHFVTRHVVTDITGRVVHVERAPVGMMVKLANKVYVVGRHGEILKVST